MKENNTMIDIDSIFETAMLTESCSCGNAKHIFSDGNLTFADIRDILTKVFSGDLRMTEKVDGIPLAITYKDGQFCICDDFKHLAEPVVSDKAEFEADEALVDAVKATVKDIVCALSALDPVLLNKYFANGQNYMLFQLVCPPVESAADYAKCFVVLQSLKCYNDKFKEVGEDTESAAELFDALRNCDCLKSGFSEISPESILSIKNATTAKNALDKVLEKLNLFIDGVGWRCSIDNYIKDKYSRHIINKALEHGLDVSRNSDFVNEFAARLSNTSGRKPTRADLQTFAKRDAIDCKSDNYKAFIQELETNADATNSEIIKPIEDLVYDAARMLMANVIGYMSADPNAKAQKALAQVDKSVLKAADDDLTAAGISKFKKNLAKIEQYHENMPAGGILFMYKGKPYKLCGGWSPANAILGLIKYK